MPSNILKKNLFGEISSKAILENYSNGEKDFSGIYLVNQSFDNINLSDANFSYSKIKGCSFKDTNLANTKFDDADIGFSYKHIISFLAAKPGIVSSKIIIPWIETIEDFLFVVVWLLIFIVVLTYVAGLGFLPFLFLISLIFALDFPRALRLRRIYESENFGVSFEKANFNWSLDK
ncbi:MAG: pentapeptide repeat-containing protein [Cyanobacteria bacterium P01_C01_bin.120]